MNGPENGGTGVARPVNHREHLLHHLRSLAVLEGDFVLSSGKSASYYVDVSRAVCGGLAGASLGDMLRRLIQEAGHEPTVYVGGPLTGAIPVVQSLLMVDSSYQSFYIRDNYKAHGAGGRLVGREPERMSYCWLVDDVVSSGGTLVEAGKWLNRNTQLTPVACYSVIDRDKGARDRIMDELGVPLYTSFTMRDLGVEQ